MSAVFPDPKDTLAEARHHAVKLRNLWEKTGSALSGLLSALDALEQAGGGESKSDSGGTAELSPVVKAQHAADLDYFSKNADDYFRMANKERARAEAAEEALRKEPAKWSFDTLLLIAERLLAENYGPDVFTGVSGDPGPRFVVALRAALAECRSALSTGDCRQAVAPKASYVSASPPSVEALEAERDEELAAERTCPTCGHVVVNDQCCEKGREVRAFYRKRAERIRTYDPRSGERLQELVDAFDAAEVGRDQANKERDEAREALRVARNDISAIALNGWDSTRIALGNEAVARIDAALAGVPGGGQQEQDLGGDRGRSPVVKGEEA